MNQIVELLQYIARSAYKAQESVKTIELYFEENSNIHRLYILLEAVKTYSIKSSLEVITQTCSDNLKESLHIINDSLESSLDIYTLLKENIHCSVSENRKNMLDANMQSLKRYFIQLNPIVIKFF